VSTAAVPATGEKASVWIRVLAYIIDAIVVAVVANILGAIFFRGNTQGSSALGIILSAAYFTWLWSASSPWPGQTLGMKLLNLKVIKTDGSLLAPSQAFIRWIGLVIPFLVSAIPVIGLFLVPLLIVIAVMWVALDPNKQGWHDKIAGTYVVRA
jgi:uncharacterized RDD family membrane protein YckC